MDNHNTSFSNSTSCRQRRSGRYGLREAFSRTHSLPTGSSYTTLDSNISKPKCEILPLLSNSVKKASVSSLKNHNTRNKDSADYISYFNSLSLGEDLSNYPKFSELFSVNDDVKPSSQIYRQNSLPVNNYNNTSSYAESLVLDLPTSSSVTGSTTSESYISSLTRSLKRRKSSLHASSSFVSDVINPINFSSDNKVDINENDSLNKSIGLVYDYSSSLSVPEVENCTLMQLCDIIRTVFFNIVRVFVNLTLFFLILLLLVFIITFYNQYKIKTCTDANNVPISIKYIKNNLTQYLVGQENAISVISDAIERYNYRKFSLGLLWIVGSVGVGKSKSISLIRNTLGNQIKLHSVYGTLLPADSHLMEGIAMKLIYELDSCRPNIVIYDEFDDKIISTKFLTVLLKFIRLERIWPVVTHGNHMKIFFIISGLYGHELITESYSKHTISGGLRHNFNYDKLKDELQNLFTPLDFPFHEVNFVPFLPLEEEHLIKCIHQEINLFAKNKIGSSGMTRSQDMDEYLKSKNLSLQYIYDTVKIMSNLSPFEYNNFLMISGCKRVHKTVNLLLTKK